MLYPAKSYDADTAAAAIFVYITRYGLDDEIISYPRSSFLSDSVAKVNAWLVIRHVLCVTMSAFDTSGESHGLVFGLVEP